MWKWLIAYICCVMSWVACDAALQYRGFFMFENFMRLPLETAFDLMGLYLAQCVTHFAPWSIGTLILVGYAALGFLPLVLVPLIGRKWPLWITAVFVLAHPAMWVFVLVCWNSAHP